MCDPRADEVEQQRNTHGSYIELCPESSQQHDLMEENQCHFEIRSSKITILVFHSLCATLTSMLAVNTAAMDTVTAMVW